MAEWTLDSLQAPTKHIRPPTRVCIAGYKAGCLPNSESGAVPLPFLHLLPELEGSEFPPLPSFWFEILLKYIINLPRWTFANFQSWLGVSINPHVVLQIKVMRVWRQFHKFPQRPRIISAILLLRCIGPTAADALESNEFRPRRSSPRDQLPLMGSDCALRPMRRW